MKHAERIQIKKEKLNRQADFLETQSQIASDRSDKISSSIPLGQPVLIGHHSERRHRKDLEKIRRLNSQFVECAKLAQKKRNLADSNSSSISSLDDDAVELLVAKLKDCEAKREHYKLLIKLCRKNDEEGLAKLGYKLSQIKAHFHSRSLANLNHHISSIKKRIATMQQNHKAIQTVEDITLNDVLLTVKDGRIQFVFKGKPDEDTRAVLKRAGYKWSPSRLAWVRAFNIYSYGHAKNLLTSLAEPVSK